MRTFSALQNTINVNSMYTIEEGQLILPDDWKDELVNVLTTSKDGKPTRKPDECQRYPAYLNDYS